MHLETAIMRNNGNLTCYCRILLASAALTASSLTGCQVDIGGQTLPSPYYQSDDVQYFPPGPEFILAREAAQMQAYKAERELEQQ